MIKEFEQNKAYAEKHDRLAAVLDKIRAEIEALEEGITSYQNDRPWIFKDEALQIIDKYRESEDKDADKKCTYKETGCGSCESQTCCPY